MVMTDERLYTVDHVAAYLQVNQYTVRRWLREGQLGGFRLGGRSAGWRIRASELERFIQTREQAEESQR
jgi:excisionase family DNA binding protein